jgi:hypothetical protein
MTRFSNRSADVKITNYLSRNYVIIVDFLNRKIGLCFADVVDPRPDGHRPFRRSRHPLVAQQILTFRDVNPSKLKK